MMGPTRSRCGVLLSALLCLWLTAAGANRLNLPSRRHEVPITTRRSNRHGAYMFRQPENQNERTRQTRHRRDARTFCVDDAFEELMNSIRGGARDLTVESDGDSGMLQKVRNLIRSVLDISEKKTPPLAKALRSVIGLVESILGIPLLPEKKKEKAASKKSKAKKKKSIKVVIEDDDEEEESIVKPKATATKKKATTKKQSTTATVQSHLQRDLKATNPNYRIQRELKAFIKDPPPNLTAKVGKNLRVWIVTIKGSKNTIYEGEAFQLRIAFPPQYPTVPPSVYFLPPNIPLHEHVYSNGDICLSLLGKDWRPTMTAQSIAVSIQSILSSAQTKSLPMDNARHAQNKPGEYQKDWVYHDDNC